MQQKVINKTVLFSVFCAAVSWGAWAYYVNIDSSNATKTGLLQAVYSSLMTIYMSFSVYFCFKRCEQKWSQLTIPALVTVGHTGAALIVMHYLNNTLNLFKTVAAPLAVATFYSLFLSWKYYSELKLKESVS